MKQMSLGVSGFEHKTKRTQKRELLDEMNLVVPWFELWYSTPMSSAGGRAKNAVNLISLFALSNLWRLRK